MTTTEPPTVSETALELADAEERLALETWKKALSIDKGGCGATNKYSKNNERCTNSAALRKTAGIDKLTEMLRRPNESPWHIETHLDSLAKVVQWP